MSVWKKTIGYLTNPHVDTSVKARKEPTANLGKLRQSQDRKNITLEDVRVGVSRNKDEFFDGMDELLGHTVTTNAALSDELYIGVQHLLPSDDTPFSVVTFSTRDGSGFRRISINKDRADGVRLARERTKANARRSGRIVEINSASQTLLLKSRTSTITTCAFDKASFEQLAADASFKIGAKLEVSGDLYERVRRDFLVVRDFTISV